MSTMFHYAVDPSGVAVITWDVGPEKSMNVLNEAGVEELDAHLDAAIADAAVKGVVVTSAKPDFAGGMDLNVLAAVRERAEAHGEPRRDGLQPSSCACTTSSAKWSGWAPTPKPARAANPLAVATPGTALGIGYEIMLGGHKRFAAENPKAKIGLPEILVGLFPGAGGTTRLIRMMGVMGAAPFLLEGKVSDPGERRKALG